MDAVFAEAGQVVIISVLEAKASRARGWMQLDFDIKISRLR